MKKSEKTIHVTTSIPISLWNIAREKRFPWNECLILGIRTMNGEGLAPNYLKMQEKIEKTETSNELLRGALTSSREKLTKLMEDKDDKQKHY